MTGVARAVFRALHEGKWLSIEYRNGSDKVTRFWAGIRGLNAKNRSLIVDGLHLHNYTVKEHTLYLDRIQWAEVVEGSFCPRNEALLRDMDNDPRRYDALFGSTANLRVLDYLAACSKLDNTPYRADYQLIERLDESRLHIASQVESDRPLVYLDVPENTTSERNTAPREVQPILHYLRRYPERSVGIITPFARQRALIRETLRDNQLPDDACGTVHAFQGDEKDVIIFSLALTDRTRQATYNWLKDNKELLNVAVSRARKQLVIVSSQKELDRLHAAAGSSDDLYELVQYTRTNGASVVTEKPAASRALGIKPYSTKTEAAFLENLNHALDNAELYGGRCVVRKEVPISQVFVEDEAGLDLFYTGRFDFVVYQKYGREERPVFAIELDGREHREDPVVQKRDRKKEAICEEHGFQLIRVENSYARRYHYIKDILIRFFKAAR